MSELCLITHNETMSVCKCVKVFMSVRPVCLSLLLGDFVCVWEDQTTVEALRFLLQHLDKNFSCLKSCHMTYKCKQSHHLFLHFYKCRVYQNEKTFLNLCWHVSTPNKNCKS